MEERGEQVREHPDKQTAMALMLWRAYLTGEYSELAPGFQTLRRIFKALPSEPRCIECNAPFRGIGAVLVRPWGYDSGRSSFNRDLCGRCERIVRKYQVGTEVQLTMLFADVRGSTSMAEEIGPSEFHHLINRYYQASTAVLTKTNALINRLIGDALIALFVPGIAGPEHGRRAVEAARALLETTGHTDPGGPWIGVGIGVHTGTAYVGAVGAADSVNDITVLGDAANTTARLSSEAAPGEILVSEATVQAFSLQLEDCEQRTLMLKGRHEPVTVRVIHV